MTNGGVGFHLWFLPSLGMCMVVVAIFLHYTSLGSLLLFALGLYFFGLINASYESFILNIPYNEVDRSFNPRNGPFMGLLFVSLGVALRLKLFRISATNGLTLVVFSAALSIIEAAFLFSYFNAPISSHNFLIGTVPLGLGAAMLCMIIDIPLPRLASAIRCVGAVSLGIYALHVMVLWEVTDLIRPSSLASGLLTAALTLMIATAGALVGAQVPVLKRVFR